MTHPDNTPPIPPDEPRSFRRLPIIAGAAGVCLLTTLTLAYTEYRTNIVAHSLGNYLADINTTRTSTGRLWDLISSEAQARSALPDTASIVTDLPTNLPPLVQNHRLTVYRIPDDGTPGYVAIQVDPIRDPASGGVDAARLVEAARLHKLGAAILKSATYDRTPFYEAARARATEMNRDLSAQMDPTDPDSSAAAVIETFTDVLVDERVAQHASDLLTAWDDGNIQQVFLNRALGDYRGEIHFTDPGQTSAAFTLSVEDVTRIFNDVAPNR